MNLLELEQRCRHLLLLPEDEEVTSQSLIGVFQRFRDRPAVFAELFAGFEAGSELSSRLAQVATASGSGQRAGGGQDAYFIVRPTTSADPESVEHHADNWLKSLQALDSMVNGSSQTSASLPALQVRVLEGLPPKQLKADEDQLPLLKWLKRDAGQLTEGLAKGCAINSLFREPCYYLACDLMLRDYVLWPTYRLPADAPNPFAHYFELWRQGVKWRVFREDQVDFYLPRV